MLTCINGNSLADIPPDELAHLLTEGNPKLVSSSSGDNRNHTLVNERRVYIEHMFKYGAQVCCGKTPPLKLSFQSWHLC